MPKHNRYAHFHAAAVLLLSTMLSTAAAQQVIDGGTVVSVPCSQGSPWKIDGKLTIGDLSTGTLTIGAGGEVTSTIGVLGNTAGSTGNATVSGAGAIWHTTESTNENGERGLIVGKFGTGTLAVSNGGVVDSDGWFYIGGYNRTDSATVPGSGTGIVSVSGVGSRLEAGVSIMLGRFAGDSGTLTVSNGATVVSNQGQVGSSGSGTALITGSGTRWTSSLTFAVGGTGNNATFDDAAELVAGSLTVGAGSTLTIKNGATATHSGGLALTGDMLIENGGKLTSTGTGINLNVGNNPGTANMKVTGAGSEWTTATDITVGRLGGSGTSNTLTIANGGKVTVNGGAGKVVLAHASLSTGTLNIGDGGAVGTLAATEVTVGGTTTRYTALVNFNHTGTTTFSANITGARLAVTKTGSGTTILTGTNTYGLATAVNGGTLLANGSLGSTAVTVANGATFGGTGTHTGTTMLQAGAKIAPGSNGVGTLTTGGTTMSAGSGFLWDIVDLGSTAGTGWDLLSVTGILALTATEANPFEISLASSETAALLSEFSAAQNYSFVIASATTGITGFNANAVDLSFGSLGALDTGGWSVGLAGDSKQLIVSHTAVVPEPATFSLLALAAAGLGLSRYRRRKQQTPL